MSCPTCLLVGVSCDDPDFKIAYPGCDCPQSECPDITDSILQGNAGSADRRKWRIPQYIFDWLVRAKSGEFVPFSDEERATFEQAFRKLKLPNDEKQRALALADFFRQQGADILYLQLLGEAADLEQDAGAQARLRLDIADDLRSLNLRSTALRAYQAVPKQVSPLLHADLIARAWQGQGRVYEAMGQFDAADVAFTNSLHFATVAGKLAGG